jgi:hypothetical protein
MHMECSVQPVLLVLSIVMSDPEHRTKGLFNIDRVIRVRVNRS